MKTVTESAKWITDGGQTYLCLAVPHREAVKFCGEMEQGKKYDLEIKLHREKRSLDSNRYLWQLLDKLADVLNSTKEELYLGYVQRYGIYRDFTLAEEAVKTFRHAWEMLGVAWPTEQVDYDGDRVVIRAYYGSSQYNSKQMSRLINAVVEDCKEQGIETLTERELSLMIGGK